MLWYNVAMKEFDELKQEALKPLVSLVEKLAKWLRNHISYSRSDKYLHLSLAGRFLYIAWGRTVAGAIEEVE
jgi:hypothetical protein